MWYNDGLREEASVGFGLTLRGLSKKQSRYLVLPVIHSFIAFIALVWVNDVTVILLYGQHQIICKLLDERNL